MSVLVRKLTPLKPLSPRKEMPARPARRLLLASGTEEAPATDLDIVAVDFAETLHRSGRRLLAGDIVGLIAAFALGGLIAFGLDIGVFHTGFQPLWSRDSLEEFALFAGLTGGSLLWLDTKGHYRQRLPYWESVYHILVVTLIGMLLAGFVQFAAKGDFSRLWLGTSWAVFAVFLFGGRGLIRRLMEQRGEWQVRALLIGDGATAKAARRALECEREMGFVIADQLPASTLGDLVGKPQGWARRMQAADASYLFLALEGGEIEASSAALKALARERVPYSIIPPWLGLPSSTVSPHNFMMQDVMLLHDTNRLTLPLPRLVKRACDIVLSGLGLFALLPLFALVALIVRKDGGPAFFKQERIGKNGRIFSCYKFRSMRVDAEEALQKLLATDAEAAREWQTFQKLKHDVRITKFGDFIRRTSIDELPQLINVFKGDMSLVGPRPIMPGQESYYADDFSYYQAVRPGITGPWQVSGRNKLTFDERVALEAWYARNWNFWLDIVILLKTVPTVLKRGQAF